jgi:hypothetical protein
MQFNIPLTHCLVKWKQILFRTCYLAVNCYFAKKEFIQPPVEKGLPHITKLHRDANLEKTITLLPMPHLSASP